MKKALKIHLNPDFLCPNHRELCVWNKNKAISALVFSNTGCYCTTVITPRIGKDQCNNHYSKACMILC